MEEEEEIEERKSQKKKPNEFRKKSMMQRGRIVKSADVSKTLEGDVKDDVDPEYKSVWQRKFNVTRESGCQGNTEFEIGLLGFKSETEGASSVTNGAAQNSFRTCPKGALASVLEVGSPANAANRTFTEFIKGPRAGIQASFSVET